MHFKDKRILTIKTPEDMERILQKGNPASQYKKGSRINVYNKMQKDYSYVLQEAPGKGMDPEFQPHYTPAEMLAEGVFEGKYLNDCLLEYPREWFLTALKKGKLSPQGPNPEINGLKVKSRLPLQEWEVKGWIPNPQGHKAKQYPALSDSELNPDRRGWFEWYCRYYMGRRIPELDRIQIQRWKAFRRHLGQIVKNCNKGDISCRPVQRQALLQWSYNPYV
jgi:hypothetical protein